MIGFFGPLVPRIVSSGARLTVAELDPALAGEGAGYRVTIDPSELASCNKVLSTSTVLLNDTLDAVLRNCRSARYFAMVGPGASCLHESLGRIQTEREKRHLRRRHHGGRRPLLFARRGAST